MRARSICVCGGCGNSDKGCKAGIRGIEKRERESAAAGCEKSTAGNRGYTRGCGDIIYRSSLGGLMMNRSYILYIYLLYCVYIVTREFVYLSNCVDCFSASFRQDIRLQYYCF